jgi:hypothetical protein
MAHLKICVSALSFLYSQSQPDDFESGYPVNSSGGNVSCVVLYVAGMLKYDNATNSCRIFPVSACKWLQTVRLILLPKTSGYSSPRKIATLLWLTSPWGHSTTIFGIVTLRPNAGHGLLILEVSRSQTVGRTPLDEWSVRHRDLYLTTHNTHNRQTPMPPRSQLASGRKRMP